jgi:outer membrane protein TolC
VPLALPLSYLLLAAPVCGPLDLEGAVALAARNADEVAIRRAELAAAEADLAIARAARVLPIGSATLLVGPVPEARGTFLNPEPGASNRNLRGLGPFVRTDVQVVQPIFTWGRLDAARDAATAGVHAREILVSDKVAELRARVVQLFWGEALARRLLGIADDVEKALAEVNQKLDELLKSGDASVKPADRYRLDVYKATLRKREAEARRGLDVAHAGLAATLGLTPSALALAEAQLSVDAGEAPDLARAQQEAERRRFDLKALDQAIAARDGEVRAAEAALKPQIFVAGTFSFAYAPNRTPQFNPWINDDFNHVAGGIALGLRQDLAFPLLTAQAGKAQAELTSLRRQRDGLARLVAQQVEAAVADVQYARERLQAATSALGSGKSWFRSAGLDFEAGVGEPKDLLEAYAGYVELQVDQQQAAYDLTVARAKLDQLTGAAPKIGEAPPACERMPVP